MAQEISESEHWCELATGQRAATYTGAPQYLQKMPNDQSILFKTEQFDYISELPCESNAGNRFYGRDVAVYFCDRLAAEGHQADYLDEDWGWLIVGQLAASTEFEIAIYNLNDHGLGGCPGAPAWGLWLRAFQRSKLLGLIPRKSEVTVSKSLSDTVVAAISALGTCAEPWADGLDS